MKKWTPAFENYSFTENGVHTEVQVDQQIHPEYASMFAEMWPNALRRLKEMCEE